MKVWVDEDLTPDIVRVANRRGYLATCNRDRSRLGVPDETLMPEVTREDYVFMTDNRDDFERLYEGRGDVHPGLIFVPGGGSAETQCDRAGRALEYIEQRAEAAHVSPADWMVNKLVEMDRHTEELAAYMLPDE